MVKTRFGKHTKEEFDFAYRNLGRVIEKIYVFFFSYNIYSLEPEQRENILTFRNSIENKKSIYKDVDDFGALKDHIWQQIPFWKESQGDNIEKQIQAIGSKYCIDRDDMKAFEMLQRDYSLIRIKAPQQYGKTSLLSRLLAEASRKDYQVIKFSFQKLNSILHSLEDLLFHICRRISRKLKIDSEIDLEMVSVLVLNNVINWSPQALLLTI
ncbi:MAG: hypothetical protein DRG30_08115 [Epsilonproteobacteria bacterium]|nr:MAG: hypothetical protein DRG30_08115 [Campylobacterota bacterium]